MVRSVNPMNMHRTFARIVLGCAALLLGLSSVSSSALAQGAEGTVVGRVQNAKTRAFLEGAQVSVAGTSVRAVTERGGSFTLLRVPAGRQILNVTYTGLDAGSQEIEVVAGGTQQVLINLSTEVYQLEKFTVAGLREGNAASITKQRNAENLVNVVSMDTFGNVADGNVGNFLQNLPGVSVNKEAGDIVGINLRGTSGASPFAVTSGPANFDLTAMRWSLALADFRLGEGESLTRFSAQTIAGRATAQGMVGELVGANGKIGAVPLNMSEIAGVWRLADGALTLNGGLQLTDAAPEARFAPLVSSDATLRFADGVIDAKAGFSERQTGTKILDTIIRHRMADGSGSADLLVKELRFDERFQPDQLTSLALGVVANVEGSVVGDGRIDWAADGVTSRGTFATADASLAAAFGPVSGLTSTLTFDDLIGLRSAPGQIAKIKEINPGIPVLDGEIEYQLLGDNRVRVEGGSWPFAGGQLLLHPTTLDFGAEQTRRLSFDIVGVDAAVFLQSFGFDNINATGKFDGTLPVEFSGLGGRIVEGRIDSREGGGTLAYVGELSNRNLGVIANFAFGALRSLKYDDLTIILNGDLDGEMVTDIRFGGVGQGEGAARNFLTNAVARIPLVFNVKITAPFRQLLTSAKGFYDPSLLIEQNLPALMRAQEEAEAAEKTRSAPVQPPESEPMR